MPHERLCRHGRASAAYCSAGSIFSRAASAVIGGCAHAASVLSRRAGNLWLALALRVAYLRVRSGEGEENKCVIANVCQ